MIGIDAESCVIGSLLATSDKEGEIFGLVTADDFGNTKNREIFESFKSFYAKYGKVDEVAACELETELKVVAVTAAMELPSISNWRMYCQLVVDNAITRRAKDLCAGLAFVDEPDDMREQAEKVLQTLNGGGSQNTVSMEDLAIGFLKRQDKPKEYIRTGFSKLDTYIQVEKGDFDIIAARPSVGKTALALNLCANIAKQGKGVAFFSLETSPEKVFDRIAASIAGINFGKIKRQTMEEDDWAKFVQASDMLVKLPLSIVKASGKSVSWIRGEALRLKADVVFIDYLGLINGTGKSRYEIITNVSMELHNMAQQTGITVFALSQLNRNATGRRPTMADLRESGQVEQDADVIVLLHRVNEDLNDMDVIIEKNKEGEVGTVKMKFWGGSQRFSEVLNRYE